MSQYAEFKIAYAGPALEQHKMDVRDLAPALLSLGQLFEEANFILNGDKASVKLQVKAHEAGSFEIIFDLYQTYGSQISQFLTGDFVTSALNLKELIVGGAAAYGGIWWFIKKLQGRNPSKVTDLKNGFVRIEIGTETFEVPTKLLRLYQDLAIRQATESVLKPLSRDGVDTFEIREGKKIVETVTKGQIRYFAAPDVPDELLLEVESKAAYSIVSLAFKEDNKWRLHDGSSTISVLISDEDFKRKVDQNIISFSKGDILRCRVKTTQWRTQSGLKTESEVLEVLEHIPAARQLLLFNTD